MSGRASRAGYLARAAVGLARCRAAGGGVVLGYHDVIPGGAVADTRWAVTEGGLRAHVRLVRALGLRIVPLADLRARVLRGDSVDGLAALTFDDGLIGVLRHAVPVLVEESAPATLFAVSAAWGVSPDWWPGAARTMTRAELVATADAGIAVEAHTRTHPSLIALPADALARELAGCRDELQDVVGRPVRALAYPRGHHDGRVRAAARAAGYDTGFTFLNGRLTGREDPFTLPRFTITSDATRWRLALHLARPADSWPDHQLPRVGPAVATTVP